MTTEKRRVKVTQKGDETWVLVQYEDNIISNPIRLQEIEDEYGECGNNLNLEPGARCLAPYTDGEYYKAVVICINDDKEKVLKEKLDLENKKRTEKKGIQKQKKQKETQKDQAGETAPKEKEQSNKKQKVQEEGKESGDGSVAKKKVVKKNAPTKKKHTEQEDDEVNQTVAKKRKEIQQEINKQRKAKTAVAQDIAASLFPKPISNSQVTDTVDLPLTTPITNNASIQLTTPNSVSNVPLTVTSVSDVQPINMPSTSANVPLTITSVSDVQPINMPSTSANVPSTVTSVSDVQPINMPSTSTVNTCNSQLNTPYTVSNISVTGASTNMPLTSNFAKNPSMQFNNTNTSMLNPPVTSSCEMNNNWIPRSCSTPNTGINMPLTNNVTNYPSMQLKTTNTGVLNAPMTSSYEVNSNWIPQNYNPFWQSSFPNPYFNYFRSSPQTHLSEEQHFPQSNTTTNGTNYFDLSACSTINSINNNVETTNNSNFLSTSVSILQETDPLPVENPIPVDSHIDNIPESPSFNSSNKSCIDCTIKDKEIYDLKKQIEELKNLAKTVESPKATVKKYQPKTRPEIISADYIKIEDNNNQVPEEFQLLAPGASIAVKSLWLHDLLSSIGKRSVKRSKKNHKPREDKETEVIKRLMDGFYQPWELAIKGGTLEFKNDAIFTSIQSYATHILKMDIPRFKRAWNTKMASARQTVGRLDGTKKEKIKSTEIQNGNNGQNNHSEISDKVDDTQEKNIESGNDEKIQNANNSQNSDDIDIID